MSTATAYVGRERRVERPDPAIAARLTAARRLAGYTQGEAVDKLRERFGEDAAIGEPALSFYENGQRAVSTHRLLQLSEVYGVDPVYLLLGERECGGVQDTRAAQFVSKWNRLPQDARDRLWRVIAALLENGR